MFKKSNRNFRTKKADLDDSDHDDSQNSKSRDSIQEIYTVEVKKSIETSTTTVLSFENEIIDEENGEEFKVKKSKESRRITKELKKSKKEKQRQQFTTETALTKENLQNEDTKKQKPVEDEINEDIFFKVKPLNRKELMQNKKQVRYLTNKYGNESNEDYEDSAEINDDQDLEEDEETNKLQRLRKEIEVLNGEEADPIENEEDDTKRSMKLLLKVGIIPDAAQIHAARKKREMARQGDYIPINNNGNQTENSKSRLIREDDENDLSEDEDNQLEANRMSLNFKQKVHIERQKNRDNFLAYENGSDDDSVKEVNENQDDDDDDEDERWEKEQIRKGVQISQGFHSKLGLSNKTNKSYLLNANMIQESMDIEDNKMYDLNQLNNLPEITFSSIKSLLKKNITALSETNNTHLNEHTMRLENLNANKADLENLKKLKPSLDQQYVYYQEMKSFIEDFTDCYSEKIDLIDRASSELIALLRQRADMLTSRRQQDFKDLSIECSAKKSVLDPNHEQRIVEREARRTRRLALRSTKSKEIIRNEGMSSDEDTDDLNEKKQEIISELNSQLINDINEEFHRFDLIKNRFEKWKSLSLDTYRTAYVSFSLPKLFSPLIKYELIDWNPLMTQQDLENFKWYTELVTYDKHNMLEYLKNNDTVQLEDFLLVPHVIEKTVILRLIELVDNVYDPMSSSQTKNLTQLLSNLIFDYPTLNSKSENTRKLIETVISRIRKCLDNDIYIPLYSKQIVEQKSSNSSLFFYRQFWSCVKLFGNLISWKGIISDKLVKEFCLDCLLNRYIMIGLQSMDASLETVEMIEYLINKLPKEWLNTNIETTKSMDLPQLSNLIRLTKRIADTVQSSNGKDTILIVRRIKTLFNNMGATDQAIAV